MYCTPAQLAEAKLARELAQLCTPERYAPVADELMEATLRGDDRSTFDPDQVAIADVALAAVATALDGADRYIDGFLLQRKPVPYTVPLSPVPLLVSEWAKHIARYFLHKDRVGTVEASDPVIRNYRDATRLLELTAAGKFSLGATDPLPPPSSGAPEYCAPERLFTLDTLGDF